MPSDARRLLVITYHFPPDGSIGGLRWAGLTKYLTRLGWEVAVVTAAPPAGSAGAATHVEFCPRHRTLLDQYRSLRRLARRSGRSLPPASHVVPPARAGLLHRLRREAAALFALPDESRGWLLRAALRTRSLLARFRPQVVVSSGPPHAAHLVARLATLGTAVRWLIDLRDPWAGPITKAWQSHPMARTATFHALFPRLERLAFRAAEAVITNTPQLAAALAARHPDVAVVCVPNGVDPESLPPPAPDPYPGLGVAYAGTLYGSRNLSPVLEALRMFFQRHPDAARAGSKLRVAGHAEPPDALTFGAHVASLGLEPHVEMLGALPRAQALAVVSRSRLVLVLAQEQELQIPAKLYESVAMGIPTLVVAGPDSAAAIEGNRVGALVRDASDVAGIAAVLERLWGDDARAPAPCPVPITYEAIAPVVDRLLLACQGAADAALTGPTGLRIAPTMRTNDVSRSPCTAMHVKA